MVVLTERAFPPRWRVAGGCVFSLALALLAFSGCGKREASAAGGGVIVGRNAKAIVNMAPAETIVAVNGRKLTRKEYDTLLDSMAQTYRVTHPGAREVDVKSYRRFLERKVVSEFMTKQVLLQEAQRRGLKPSADELARLEKLLEARAKKEGKTLEQFERDAPEKVRTLRDGIREQALVAALREAEFGDRLKITEADLQAGRDRISKFNAMGEQTNVWVKARGAALCERLRTGEAFADVAAQESEVDEESGPGIWGEFSREEINDPNVARAAFTLPVGAVSEPFDTEEGLVIIKVLERKGLDSPVARNRATVKLGRILLRLVELRTMPGDAELRKELERNRLETLQKEWLKALQMKARIEFPQGTNLWLTAEKKKTK